MHSTQINRRIHSTQKDRSMHLYFNSQISRWNDLALSVWTYSEPKHLIMPQQTNTCIYLKQNRHTHYTLTNRSYHSARENLALSNAPHQTDTGLFIFLENNTQSITISLGLQITFCVFPKSGYYIHSISDFGNSLLCAVTAGEFIHSPYDYLIYLLF